MKDPIESTKGLVAFTIFIVMALTGLIMSLIHGFDGDKKE